MTTSLQLIETSQASWVKPGTCDPLRPDYAATIGANLFLQRLKDETEAEFLEADGSELRDSSRRPAKMRALLSSSALAVNFFDAWRTVDKGPLGPALALEGPLTDFRFEYVCKHYPVPPRSPNLDLLVTLADGRRIAVESKFAEPFRSPGRDAHLAGKYFEGRARHWAQAGLHSSAISC